MAVTSGAEYVPVEQILLEADREGQLNRIGQKLAGCNSFHPFLRASLEAVYIKGEPAVGSDSLHAANTLAEGLISVDQRLRTAEKPIPIAAVTHKYMLREDRTRHNQLQVDYGLSIPGEGLHIQKNFTGSETPYIEFPVLDEPQPIGIATPSWNSHYVKSKPHSRAVVVSRYGNKQRSRDYPKPTPGNFVLPLPGGSLYSRSERPWPLIAWDNSNGVRHDIKVPKDHLGRPDVAVFVGRQSVKAGLEVIYRRMLDVERGIIPYNNELQPKYEPKVIKAMTHEVLADLEELQRGS